MNIAIPKVRRVNLHWNKDWLSGWAEMRGLGLILERTDRSGINGKTMRQDVVGESRLHDVDYWSYLNSCAHKSREGIDT